MAETGSTDPLSDSSVDSWCSKRSFIYTEFCHRVTSTKGSHKSKDNIDKCVS